MSQNTLSPNDPKFTAYALGELDPAEHAAIEAALRDNPAARAAVEEIRATAAQLSEAFAAEPAPEVLPLSIPVSSRATTVREDKYRKRKVGPFGQLLEFPQVYYVIGGFAAACFAIMVVLHEPQAHPPRVNALAENAGEQKVYATITFSPIPSGGTEVASSLPAATVATTLAENAPATTAAPSEVRVADTNTVSDQKDFTLLEQVKRESTQPEPTSIALSNETTPLMTSTPSQPAAAPVLQASLVEAVKSPEALADAATAAGKAAGYEISVDQNDVNRLRGVSAASSLAANQPSSSASATSNAGAAGAGAVQLPSFRVATSRNPGSASKNNAIWNRTLNFQKSAEGPTDLVLSPVSKNTESYSYNAENEFLPALSNPLSTFAVDVDTASYSNLRRFVEGGHLPSVDAVRIEEMLNYFSYAYPEPKDDQPFAASLEVASAPWAPTHRLVRLGLKGRVVSTEARAGANLVFLLDVSGSMNAANRLPLVKEAMRVLVGKLRPDDHVAIVTYAGQSGLALASTPVSQSREILAALDSLSAGGATHGALGIQLAYDIAKANFVAGGINRVILCTDGDFNIGISSEGALTRLIGEKAKSGVFLTVLGFGMGNLKDAMLEKLADKGNGNYGYIDSLREAQKLLGEQVNGTLLTIAKDVKIQVEFNPAKVASYRLIGYENRLLKKEDFNNEKVDAGEIGAGHTVTALYEIVPVGAEEKSGEATPSVDALKYQTKTADRSRATASAKAETGSDELLTVKVSYKKPDGILSRKLEFPLIDHGGLFANATPDFKFAAAVASFGMILRDSSHKGSATLGDIIAWAGTGINQDPGGYRAEFINLVTAARRLTSPNTQVEK